MIGAASIGGRVAHVMRHFGEPSQTFVPDAIRGLDALGWEGWVVTGENRNSGWYDFPQDRVLVAERAPLMERAIGRLRYRTALERSATGFSRQIARVKPALIHAHFGWAGPLAAASSSRLGVPLVITFHATDVVVWPYQREENLAAYARLFPKVTTAIAVSEFTASKLREAGWRGPVEIEPAGVSLDELPFRSSLPRRDGLRVLFIGRLVPRKGLDILLRALAELPDEPAVALSVVGDGPQRAECEQLATDLGIASKVTFHGALPKSGVKLALLESDVFVMPSRTTTEGEAEGSPVALKEALAVGVPIVATDNGGTIEVMPPALRPEIVAQDDPQGLAARLKALIDDRDNWPARARLGRQWTEDQFDSEKLAARLSTLYTAAIEGRQR